MSSKMLQIKIHPPSMKAAQALTFGVQYLFWRILAVVRLWRNPRPILRSTLLRPRMVLPAKFYQNWPSCFPSRWCRKFCRQT